jgi:SAM-dependent methyltransferase
LNALPRRFARRFAQGLFKFKTVKICNSCGLGVLDPMPAENDLKRFYENFFDEEIAPDVLPSLHPRGVSQANFLAQSIDLTTIRESLEFGSGSAALTRKLKEFRPDVRSTVVEVSRLMLAPLAKDPAIDEATTNYRGPQEHFDLVMTSHSLEHVHDVKKTLEEWASWVRPGGWLMIEVPHANPDHYAVAHEYVPHGYFFTKTSLALLVEAAGLETVSIGGGGQTWAGARRGEPYPTDPTVWKTTGDSGANLRGLWRKRIVA